MSTNISQNLDSQKSDNPNRRKEFTPGKTTYGYGTARANQNVEETSIENFIKKKSSPSYSTEIDKTYQVLVKRGAASRTELSVYTGFPINKITQYAKVLLQNEWAVEDDEKSICPINKTKVRILRVRSKIKNNPVDKIEQKKGEQSSLFNLDQPERSGYNLQNFQDF